MASAIHPDAVVDPSAELAENVEVGPFAVIGAGVEVGAGCEVGAGAQLRGPASLGTGNRIFPHACIGFEPQDLKFGGEETRLEVGDDNDFREFCSVHRGTADGGGVTRIGSDNLFMAYTHVAHDCLVGDRTVFANGATLAGHVEVHDDATISAFSAVHQFCRVGRHAYIGGYSVLTQDALPFAKTVGQRPACYGLNRIGLERSGLEEKTIERLDRAVRSLLRGGKLEGILASLSREHGGDPDVEYLIDFVETAERGIVRARPGRGRGRGG